MSGDARIVAEVTDLEVVHEFTKAGVMVKNSLETGEPMAFTGVTGENGSEVIRRSGPGEPLWSKIPNDDISPPYWFRIDRVDDLVTYSVSPDGERWHPFDQQRLPLEDTVYVGLAVCSHDPEVTVTARFESVSIEADDGT